jgi:glycosyltransferase involved in cell wall biosynthesis
MKKKVFSIDFQLYKVTGVEKVMLDIHHAIQDEYEARIVGNIPFKKVHKSHSIKAEEYIKFNNPFLFFNSIVIVHERKLLLLFWILNHILFQRIKIVYIHHSLFYNHKRTTILPKTIVAIADKGIENLTQYFRAPIQNIHKIHNCVKDNYKAPHGINNKVRISLMLPGRINSFKQQFEIVNHLKGKLDKRITIRFAGDGERLDELRYLCEGDANFEVLGYREDVIELLGETDYMLLYSSQEGLSITLIEATMVGMPIVCNDVGGNAEICHDGENGWVVNDWEELIKTLNNLTDITEEQYSTMCRNSRRIYEDNFTFELFKKNYLELLSQLK